MMKAKKFLSFLAFGLTVLLLMTSLPIVTLAETAAQAAAAEQALLAEIDAMLAEDRVAGEIVFFMKEGITLEETGEILGEIDVPNDFDDESVYVYRSDLDEIANSKRLWFTVHVSETEIRNMVYKLLTCEFISHVSLNWTVSPAEVMEADIKVDTYSIIESWNKETAIAETTSESETVYDPQTSTWALDKMGISSAWNSSFTGRSAVVVAVLDTGYTEHPDTKNLNIMHPADVRGAEPYSDDVTDEDGHGTFIIGQIAASLDGSGVNGICQNVTIVPVKIATYNQDTGNSAASITDICKGITYAESIGADVINFSFSKSAKLYETMLEKNIEFSGIFVTSAGNDGVDITYADQGSGAANDELNWIVVGSSTAEDTRASYSNWSAGYVDLFAPGDGIVGVAVGKTRANDFSIDGVRYTVCSGTSMAAPQVTAIVAVLLAHATHLSPLEIRKLILENVTPVDALIGRCDYDGIASLSRVISVLYAESRPAYSKGDLNGDGVINEPDYTIVKRAVLGTYTLNNIQTKAADVNSDGLVNATDYIMIQRYVSNTYYFPPE